MRRRVIEKHFRLNAEENRKLKDLALKSGLSESAVVRSLLDSVIIKEMPTKEFFEAINQIRKVGTNINQIARFANATGKINNENLNRYLRDLDNLMITIMKKYL